MVGVRGGAGLPPSISPVLGSWVSQAAAELPSGPVGPGFESLLPALLSSVIRGMLLDFSGPQFPHWFNGDPPTGTDGWLDDKCECIKHRAWHTAGAQ